MFLGRYFLILPGRSFRMSGERLRRSIWKEHPGQFHTKRPLGISGGMWQKNGTLEVGISGSSSESDVSIVDATEKSESY
jgi:hypothetical protein